MAGATLHTVFWRGLLEGDSCVQSGGSEGTRRAATREQSIWGGNSHLYVLSHNNMNVRVLSLNLVN